MYHRQTDEYARDFAFFLRHTDEKEVLFRHILKRIERAKKGSVLEIGPGANASLACELCAMFGSYTGVEMNPEHAAALRAAFPDAHPDRFAVVEGRFPEALPAGNYDYLICCHALPSGVDDYEPFLNHALSLTPEGLVLVITYDAEQSEWRSFLKKAGLSSDNYEKGRLERLGRILKSRGISRKYTIETKVSAGMIEDMVLALSFVYSDGIPQRKERFLLSDAVREELKANYRNRGTFEFPFLHYVFET